MLGTAHNAVAVGSHKHPEMWIFLPILPKEKEAEKRFLISARSHLQAESSPELSLGHRSIQREGQRPSFSKARAGFRLTQGTPWGGDGSGEAWEAPPRTRVESGAGQQRRTLLHRPRLPGSWAPPRHLEPLTRARGLVSWAAAVR